jgi:hypothetical protein
MESSRVIFLQMMGVGSNILARTSHFTQNNFQISSHDKRIIVITLNNVPELGFGK